MENTLIAGSRVTTATVVGVVSPRTQDGTVATLSALASSGVRPLFISLGTGAGVQRTHENGVAIIEGLLPRYLDNAVAALRLSSLPTLAWWRADEPEVLEQLAPLVDRVVLDVDDPATTWSLVPELARRTSVSDMRWVRLTRWRDLIAQFFDIPEVRAVADRFDRVELRGTDRYQLRLLSGWLAARLPTKREVQIAIEDGGAGAVECVRIHSADTRLGVSLLSDRACLETSVQRGAGDPAVRVVPADESTPLALISEELRVRSRDFAFEAAVQMAGKL
jgi:glucose-6-phosphate dehydrogenase assembly protein OpcA